MPAENTLQREWLEAAGFQHVDDNDRDGEALYQGHKLSLCVPLDATNPMVLMQHIIHAAQTTATKEMRKRAQEFFGGDLGLAVKT